MFDFDDLEVLDPIATPPASNVGGPSNIDSTGSDNCPVQSRTEVTTQGPSATGVGNSEPRYWKVVYAPLTAGLEVRSEGKGEDKSDYWHLPLHSVVLEKDRNGNELRISELESSTTTVPPRMGWIQIECASRTSLICLGNSPVEAQPSPPESSPSAKPTLPEPSPSVPSPPEPSLPPPSTNSRRALILFDWDDTLCPTTWIQACPQLRDALNGFRGPRRVGEVWDKLRDHARAVKQLMQTATSLGTVAFVTLAERPWVAISVRDFMPEADSVINIEVFYARENTMLNFSVGGCPLTAMKRKAIEQATEQLKPDAGWENLISVGDSEVERRATHEVGRAMQNRGAVKWTKTVKMREHPDVGQLTMQIWALNERLAELVGHPGPKNLTSKDLWVRPR